MGLFEEFKKQLGKRIILIPKKGDNPVSEIKEHAHSSNICVCDFYVKGCEEGEIKPWGLEFKDLLIIDHHAPRNEFMRYVSSGTLAGKYHEENGLLPQDYKIIINHTDCDSIISMLIMSGLIKPEQRFLDAVIAADHFGYQNIIADTLQGVQYENIEFIIKTFEELLNNDKISPKAKELYEKRVKERAVFKKFVNCGEVRFFKDIAYMIHEAEVDPTLVASQVPEAKVVFIAYPSPKEAKKKWFMRFRLGPSGEGIILNKLELPEFGGRWNAGSNRRTGGTDIEPRDYAKIIHDKIEEFFLAPKKK